MDFEERETQRKKQIVKVAIAEIGMVISVIAIVVVATLAAMGFFVSSNGTIEQNGLMQLHSLPTGATTELDGSVLFARTNLSRSLTAGEHTIKLSRDGYDSWSKTITMSSGMLARLYYPRLFLLERQPEVAAQLGTDIEFYAVSDDQQFIIYAAQQSTKWQLLNLRNDDLPRVTTLDLSEVLPNVEEEVFTGRIEEVRWSKNNDQVLVRISTEAGREWILLNLKDIQQSRNLTKIFGLDFTQVEMIDDSAAQLFVLENHQLRRVNTVDQAISRVLLNNVTNFANYKTNVIYVANTTKDNIKAQSIGVYRDGEQGGTVLANVDESATVRVALTRYYDEEYLAYIVDQNLTIYYGAIPTYREAVDQTDFSGLKLLLEQELLVAPKNLKLSPEGEYFVAQNGKNYMVVDLEMGELYEYEAPTPNYFWLDESLMGVVTDNSALQVWDFDYTNQRVLVRTVAEDQEVELAPVTTRTDLTLSNYPAIISDNDRWLYYVVYTTRGLTLMREKIRD